MILQIHLPDDLYAKYAERDPAKPQAVLEAALADAVGLVPGEQRILFRGDELRALKVLLDHPVSTAGEVLRGIERFRRVSLPEGVTLDLDAGQLTRLRALFDSSGFQMTFGEFVRRQLTAGLRAVL